MKYSSIEELTKEHRWQRADNYSGTDYSDFVVGLSKTRDGDLLEQSNFDVLLERLGGEKDGVVEVVHFSHWACGWVETILVSVKAKRKLKLLMEQLNALEEYAVLDDEHFHELEREDMYAQFEQYQYDFQLNVLKLMRRASPELIADEQQWREFLMGVFEFAVEWDGLEDAYVTSATVERFIKNESGRYGRMTRLIEDGNVVAIKLQRVLGVVV